MFVEVLCSDKGLLRQGVCSLRLQIVAAELRIIWTRHVQHRVAMTHFLPRDYDDSAYRPAHLSDDRRSAKTVVSYRTVQTQGSSQFSRLNRQNLHMRHLVRRNSNRVPMLKVLP